MPFFSCAWGAILALVLPTIVGTTYNILCTKCIIFFSLRFSETVQSLSPGNSNKTYSRSLGWPGAGQLLLPQMSFYVHGWFHWGVFQESSREPWLLYFRWGPHISLYNTNHSPPDTTSGGLGPDKSLHFCSHTPSRPGSLCIPSERGTHKPTHLQRSAYRRHCSSL